jgi:hypothetical protein
MYDNAALDCQPKALKKLTETDLVLYEGGYSARCALYVGLGLGMTVGATIAFGPVAGAAVFFGVLNLSGPSCC